MSLLTSAICEAKFGQPTPEMERKWMGMFTTGVGPVLPLHAIPTRIYCHKLLIEPLREALELLYERKLHQEIKTWDGCFNVRVKRGGKTLSLHSWGLACDINSSDNIMGMSYDELIKIGRQPLSEEVLQCFRDAGFDCGGDWHSPDRMHFQISHI